MLHRRRRGCSTARMRSTSSRSARSPSRTASWSSWRPGTERTSSARSRRRSERSDFLAMIDACTAAGVRLMIHENWRFRPWYRALRAEIDAGLIGRPIRLRIAHRDTRALRPDGFADQPYLATMPRLILMDMGCHLVDTARYLIGEIQTVSAIDRPVRASNGGRGRRDAGGLLRRRCAGLARPELVHAARGCAAGMGAEPDRRRGHRRHRAAPDRRLARVDQSRRPPRAEAGPAARRTTRSTSTATPPPSGTSSTGLLTGAEHETRASDNLKTMDVVWAAYRSAEEGRTVSV